MYFGGLRFAAVGVGCGCGGGGWGGGCWEKEAEQEEEGEEKSHCHRMGSHEAGRDGEVVLCVQAALRSLGIRRNFDDDGVRWPGWSVGLTSYKLYWDAGPFDMSVPRWTSS